MHLPHQSDNYTGSDTVAVYEERLHKPQWNKRGHKYMLTNGKHLNIYSAVGV